jgi:hypothetical protein
VQARDDATDEPDGDYDMDQFVNDYILSRDIPDGPTEVVARDGTEGGNADQFINALLQSRDTTVTPEDLLMIAALASRALDDLD